MGTAHLACATLLLTSVTRALIFFCPPPCCCCFCCCSWVRSRLLESEVHELQQRLQQQDAKTRAIDTQLAAASVNSAAQHSAAQHARSRIRADRQIATKEVDWAHSGTRAAAVPLCCGRAAVGIRGPADSLLSVCACATVARTLLFELVLISLERNKLLDGEIVRLRK